MPGRVLVEQVHLELGVLRLRHDRGAGPPAVVAPAVVLAEAVVVQRGARGLVAGDEPGPDAAGEEHAVDRAGLVGEVSLLAHGEQYGFALPEQKPGGQDKEKGSAQRLLDRAAHVAHVREQRQRVVVGAAAPGAPHAQRAGAQVGLANGRLLAFRPLDLLGADAAVLLQNLQRLLEQLLLDLPFAPDPVIERALRLLDSGSDEEA